MNKVNIPYGDARATVNEVGGNKGDWPAERPGHVAAHEAGHSMGLPDQYREVRNQYPTDIGWEDNIMGSFDGIVEERNIKMILELNKTQYDENCGCE